MLYFNRNGVSFKIPIGKDVVYDHDLLERQIKVALNGLQNLKDRSPYIEQLRHELPGQHIVESAFGRDDITINPTSIAILKKRREIENPKLFLPLTVIDVFGEDALTGFDIAQFFKISACEYFDRYVADSGAENVADYFLELQEENSRTFIQIDELEPITDVYITDDWEFNDTRWSSGYLPPFPGFFEGFECFTCTGNPYCGGCPALDVGYQNVSIYGSAQLNPLLFGLFSHGPVGTAYWFSHNLTCKPSGATPCEPFIGGNSWNGPMNIDSYGTYSSSFDQLFLCGEHEIRRFSGSLSNYSHYYGIVSGGYNGITGGDLQTAHNYSDIILWGGRGVSDASRHICCWTQQDMSGEWSERAPTTTLYGEMPMKTQYEGGFPLTDHGSDSCAPFDELYERPVSLYVSIDGGIDFLIGDDFSSWENFYFESEIFNFNGEPFYMYSLYMTSFNDAYAREKIHYGAIYQGLHHRLVFDSTGIRSWEHNFISATYISPADEEQDINFGNAYDGLTGKITYGLRNFRADKIYRQDTLQQVAEV